MLPGILTLKELQMLFKGYCLKQNFLAEVKNDSKNIVFLVDGEGSYLLELSITNLFLLLTLAYAVVKTKTQYILTGL